VRNQPGHFLPIILKTGIDRNGLIRLLHGNNHALITRKDHVSLELIFFDFCAFITGKLVLSILGIGSLTPLRPGPVSPLYKVPDFFASTGHRFINLLITGFS
jgi:hypothetical protein